MLTSRASLSKNTVAACKDDVRLTYALYLKHLGGALESPWIKGSQTIREMMKLIKQCPSCKAKDAYLLVEEDFEEMSEGQMAEYLAGNFGTVVCKICNTYTDFGEY